MSTKPITQLQKELLAFNEMTPQFFDEEKCKDLHATYDERVTIGWHLCDPADDYLDDEEGNELSFATEEEAWQYLWRTTEPYYRKVFDEASFGVDFDMLWLAWLGEEANNHE